MESIIKIKEKLDTNQFEERKEKREQFASIEKFLFSINCSIFTYLSLWLKKFALRFVAKKFSEKFVTKLWIPYIAINKTERKIQIFERWGHNPPARPLDKMIPDDRLTRYGIELVDIERPLVCIQIGTILDKKRLLTLINNTVTKRK